MKDRALIALIGLNAFYRESIKRLLTENGYDIEENCNRPPNLAIVDGANGATLTLCEVDEISRLHPSTYVVVLNGGLSWKPADILNAFRHGISAYLTQQRQELFLKTLEIVLLGETVVPRDAVMASERHEERAPVLSKRELDILKELAKGDTNKVIARVFCVTEATVKVHVKSILRKLRLQNRTQAAVWGVRFLASMKGQELGRIDGEISRLLLEPPEPILALMDGTKS